jgi:hypothetical protein
VTGIGTPGAAIPFGISGPGSGFRVDDAGQGTDCSEPQDFPAFGWAVTGMAARSLIIA